MEQACGLCRRQYRCPTQLLDVLPGWELSGSSGSRRAFGQAGNYRDAPALWQEAAAKAGWLGEQVLVLAGEFPMGSAD